MKIRRFVQDERGAATILEYTIVLPIVMSIIIVLMLTGYVYYERASLESAAQRTALYVSKTMSDPNYVAITTRSPSSTEISSIAVPSSGLERDPYRFLANNYNDVSSSETDTIRQIISDNQALVRTGARISISNLNVSVVPKAGLCPSVTVYASETFAMPNLFNIIVFKPIEIKVQATAAVTEPAEFVRNADLAVDLVTTIGDATGITDKLRTMQDQVRTIFGSNGFGG